MTKGHGFIWMPRDWRTGTRELSLEARGVYADIISMLHEYGGRLKHDEDALCAGIGLRSVRVLRRLLGELVAKGKISIAEGYIYNGRVTRDLAERARRRDEKTGHGDNPQAVETPVKKAAPLSGFGEVSSMFGECLTEVWPKLTAPLLEFVGENPDLGASSLIPIPTRSIETPSPLPRARDPGGGGRRPLGETAGEPPRPTGFRWARPETAMTKLWLVLIERGMDAGEALALIERASDPGHPGFGEASRWCATVSWQHRCGWYPPKPVVH